MPILPDWLTSGQYGGGLLGGIAAPVVAAAEPSILDRLDRGLSDNSMMLLGLGAGIARGGLGRGLQMALPGALADQQDRKARQGRAAIMQALQAKGLAPTEIAAAGASPEFAKMLIARAYPELKFEKAEQLYGAFNPTTGQFTPQGAAPKLEKLYQGQSAGYYAPPLPSRPSGVGSQGAVAPVQTGEPKLDDVSGVRKEITGRPEVNRYSESLPVFRSMIQSQAKDSAAADLDLVHGVAKIFDPDSVVREGEMKLAGKAQSIPEDVQGLIKRVAFGEGRLTPPTRARILQIARTRMDELKRSLVERGAPLPDPE